MRTFRIIILIILTGCQFARAQKINRFNNKGQRTGKWIEYEDSTKSIKLFEGRFRKGNAVGKARYYADHGILARKEINRFKILKTTNYYPNGNKRSEGRARIENLPDKIHYYYYGRWKHYDENGKAVKYCYYTKGQLVKSVYINKSNFTNDSLVKALNEIEKEFIEKNTTLINEINTLAPNAKKSELVREKLQHLDSIAFAGIEQILGQYGYPAKARVGESGNIPFFVISYAPREKRQKYQALFEDAANKGDLDWPALAHFIDKLSLALGRQQVYGTQYYFDAKSGLVYYPIFDEQHLNERRKQVGLPVD